MGLYLWVLKHLIRAAFKVHKREKYTETAIQLLASIKEDKAFEAKGEVLSFGLQHEIRINKCLCAIYVANKQLVILLDDGTDVRKYHIDQILVIRPKSDDLRLKYATYPGGYIKLDDMSDPATDNFADRELNKNKAKQLFNVLLEHGAREIDKV